eukprot:TRINITY_DN6318_c0_g1_i4.p1 TRINITY_DN6318_c0_g1~~TRINITY_DN6318_c0_g1_i4.p1  ORF type:complete len:826 (-),score=239.07 TRINITY_DN6318_c0_g1_i4:120-2597(-)
MSNEDGEQHQPSSTSEPKSIQDRIKAINLENVFQPPQVGGAPPTLATRKSGHFPKPELKLEPNHNNSGPPSPQIPPNNEEGSSPTPSTAPPPPPPSRTSRPVSALPIQRPAASMTMPLPSVPKTASSLELTEAEKSGKSTLTSSGESKTIAIKRSTSSKEKFPAVDSSSSSSPSGSSPVRVTTKPAFNRSSGSWRTASVNNEPGGIEKPVTTVVEKRGFLSRNSRNSFKLPDDIFTSSPPTSTSPSKPSSLSSSLNNDTVLPPVSENKPETTHSPTVSKLNLERAGSNKSESESLDDSATKTPSTPGGADSSTSDTARTPLRSTPSSLSLKSMSASIVGLTPRSSKLLKLQLHEESILSQALLMKQQTGMLSKDQKKEISKWLKKKEGAAPPVDEILEIIRSNKKVKRNVNKRLPTKTNDAAALQSHRFAHELSADLGAVFSNINTLFDSFESSLYDNLNNASEDQDLNAQCAHQKTLLEQNVSKVSAMLSSIAAYFKEIPFSSSETDSPLSVVHNKTFDEFKKEIVGKVIPIHEKSLKERHIVFALKQNLLNSLHSSCRNLHDCSVYFLSFILSADTSSITCYMSVLATLRSFVQLFKEILDDCETFCHLQTLTYGEVKFKPTVQQEPTGKLISTEVSLWNEGPEPKGTAVDPNDEYRPGTLNNLIIRLTSPNTNIEYVTTFLNQYTSFCTPVELINKLLDRYTTPDTLSDNEKLLIKQRTATVIIQWIKLELHHIDTSLISRIKEFADKTLPLDKLSSFANTLNQELKKKIEIKESFHFEDKISTFDMKGIVINKMIFQLDPMDVAEQLTLLDVEIFDKIRFR